MTGNELKPAFTTATGCSDWLATTPLGDAIQAQAHFLRQLNQLNRTTIAPEERLAIVELLREPVSLAQGEAARRFAGKPLPLVPPEQAAFGAAQAVWQGMLANYRHCLDAALADSAAMKERLPLLIQRAVATLTEIQFDIYRAGFQPAPEHWRALHHLYAIAERSGIGERQVKDTLRHGRNASSPRVAYIEAMLLHTANPHELPLRQLGWVARWARRWSAKVSVLATAPAPGSPVTALCIDLASNQPAGYRTLAGASARWLDTTEVRPSLKKRLALLESGTSPAELQLGDDCAQPACSEVLKMVYRRWCKGGMARRHERRPATGKCQAIVGIDAIHYYVSGQRPFRQPGAVDDHALRQERDELATFGRVTARRVSGFSQQQGFHVDDWQVVEEWQTIDESTSGLQLAYPVARAGIRISQGQLMALRPADAANMLLGCVRWTMVTGDSHLHAGIQIIAGHPEPVAVRVIDDAAREPFRPGFLLPELPAAGLAGGIVVPPYSFRPGRTVEIAGPRGLYRVRLLRLIDRGHDFDRASFEAM